MSTDMIGGQPTAPDTSSNPPSKGNSSKYDEEEVLKEVCSSNGITYNKLSAGEGGSLHKMEMFFSGYPRIMGMHHFPNLTTVAIMGQTISKLEGLQGLLRLKELWVCECQIKKIENLDANKNLHKLYLYSNQIRTIENLDRLTELEVLWLNHNQISDIDNIQHLTRLRELNLAENRISRIGHSLDANTRLEELNLSGNRIFSLKELTHLVRLRKLRSLSLKDPLYMPSPVALLCNYSTHVLFHMPNLEKLDTYDISAKHLSELAETTVNKKKMFYNMRVRTVKRNMTDMLKRLNSYKDEVLDVPYSRIRVLTNAIKEVQRELQDILGQSAEAMSDLTESESDSDKDRRIAGAEEAALRRKLMSLFKRRAKWDKICDEMGMYCLEAKARVRGTADTLLHRLTVELETGGNVRFEEGSPSDVWFASCHDLVLSRFCAADYREYNIEGLKVHRIIRIHNKILRSRFDERLSAITEDLDAEFYPSMKNLSYKKQLEYLFWNTDPVTAGRQHDVDRIMEEGFPDGDTYMKLGCDEAVPMCNSLSLADRRRIKHAVKQTKSNGEPCPFRFGQLIVAKVYLGKSIGALEDRKISPLTYQKIDSVFRPRRKCISAGNASEAEGQRSCECFARQCEWFIFDNELVLPEYVVEYEYLTQSKPKNPFTCISDDPLEKEFRISAPQYIDERFHGSDDDVLKMEPSIKPRLRLLTLNEEVLLKAARAEVLSGITVLNLHGSGLSKLKAIQTLTNLRFLIVSFNELAKLDDLSYMTLEYLDASFNKIGTLDGMKNMSKLRHLDVSWNKLQYTREELSLLKKHMGGLQTLDISHNPWLKCHDEGEDEYPEDGYSEFERADRDLAHEELVTEEADGLRLRVIGRMKGLTKLNRKPVTEEEATAALRVTTGARISQLSLLNFSRTDHTMPRTFLLGNGGQVICQISHLKPERISEQDHTWFSRITALNLENQHLTKLSNLDRLENLRWACFDNNDLTKIEGLDNCQMLEELSFEHNCISKVDGLSKLTKLQKLNLADNCIGQLDPGLFMHLPYLVFLSLANNKINSLAGFQRLASLVELYVGNNNLLNIRDIFYLKNLQHLVILDLLGNPLVTLSDNYRLFVIYHLKSLKALDGLAIESAEGNSAKDMFGGRLTTDFVAERLSHSNFQEVRELDLPNCAIRNVDLGSGEQFINLRSVNLEQNNLTSFSGLIHLVNLRILCLNHNHIECIVPKSKSVNPKQKFIGGVTGKSSDFLQDSFTPVLENLEVLHLGYNNIRDMLALQLSRLPALKAVFLQGNEISKIEGLDGLHDLRELVLDRNKIKAVSETSFLNQWNLQELHLEENRLRDLSNLSCLEGLQRLYLGSNRVQDLPELEKLDGLNNLIEISLVNNVVARRMVHRPMLVYRMPSLLVIDGIPVSEEERAKAELYFADQQPTVTQTTTVEATLPGIGQYKTQIPVKVTNMQLTSPAHLSSTVYYDDTEPVQRGGGRRRGLVKTDSTGQLNMRGNMSYANPVGGQSNFYNIGNAAGNRSNYFLNSLPYSNQTAEYVDNLGRMNAKNNRR